MQRRSSFIIQVLFHYAAYDASLNLFLWAAFVYKAASEVICNHDTASFFLFFTKKALLSTFSSQKEVTCEHSPSV